MTDDRNRGRRGRPPRPPADHELSTRPPARGDSARRGPRLTLRAPADEPARGRGQPRDERSGQRREPRERAEDARAGRPLRTRFTAPTAGRRDDHADRPGRPDRPRRPDDARAQTRDGGRAGPGRTEPRGPRPDRAGAGREPARAERPAPRPAPPRSSARGRPPERQTEVAPQRIAKALARAGVASRRDIERMIGEGRIAIEGEPLTSPALNITSLKGVTVDGQPVAGIAPAKLYRFHKPAGFLTAARDPAGRPTIMDIMPPALPRVVPVGRLDMNTEGLLLLTTDGELKRLLELPSTGVPRVYRVRAFGEVTQKALESLADGITIDGVHYGLILADIERRTGHNLWLTVTITEGKNREVRRVLEHIGLQVNRLIRIAYGPIGLDDLPPRMADEVPEAALQALKAILKPAGGPRGRSRP